MKKSLLLLSLIFPSAALSNTVNQKSTAMLISEQISSNHRLTSDTWHFIPLVSLALPAGFSLVAAERLLKNDLAGASMAGAGVLFTALLTKALYIADKNIEQERLEQAERLIKEQTKLEKNETV